MRIPGGSFTMGSPRNETGSKFDERPQHEVTLSPFLIAKYEVSQRQWHCIVDEGDPPFSHPELPIMDLFQAELDEFLAQTGTRLPTEAEWEYACRAGTATPFAFGKRLRADHARFDRPNYEGPWNCRFGAPNAFGLYNMHGNVSELCRDVYDARAYRKHGPINPVVGPWPNVLRGGHWMSSSEGCRSGA
ncbi:MAG: formylglycine-generating enzyme family protein, partial [Planctomycetota bacterium]